MDVPPFMEVSKKNFFKKNFRKHLAVTIKSLTFASAFNTIRANTTYIGQPDDVKIVIEKNERYTL